MHYYKYNGLITPVNLSEEYIVEVLGFDRKLIREGRYSVSLQQQILHEHLLLESWFKKGMEFLKKKGVEGLEKVKDKAYEIKDGIKDYGENMKGVVAALTAMVNDPEEFKKYRSIMKKSLQNWPERVVNGLAKIAESLGDFKMPTFAKGLEIVKKGLAKAWQMVVGTTGWKGVLSLMAFGLAVKWIDDEFEVGKRIKHLKAIFEEMGLAWKAEGKKEKLKHVKNIYSNVKAMKSEAVDILIQPNNVLLTEAENDEEVENWLMGQNKDVSEGSDAFKVIVEWLKEKFGFVEMLKEKIQKAIANVAGKALEQMAGPIGWIKELVEMYKKSAWVLEGLAEMLVEPDDMMMQN